MINELYKSLTSETLVTEINCVTTTYDELRELSVELCNSKLIAVDIRMTNQSINFVTSLSELQAELKSLMVDKFYCYVKETLLSLQCGNTVLRNRLLYIRDYINDQCNKFYDDVETHLVQQINNILSYYSNVSDNDVVIVNTGIIEEFRCSLYKLLCLHPSPVSNDCDICDRVDAWNLHMQRLLRNILNYRSYVVFSNHHSGCPPPEEHIVQQQQECDCVDCEGELCCNQKEATRYIIRLLTDLLEQIREHLTEGDQIPSNLFQNNCGGQAPADLHQKKLEVAVDVAMIDERNPTLRSNVETLTL